jgi:prephenate dehydrogenase
VKINRIAIIGTGLIGASVGLALKAAGFDGQILGWDQSRAEAAEALQLGALDVVLPGIEELFVPGLADVYLLATPVLPMLDWLERLAPVLTEGQLITDVGSTKRQLCERAVRLYNRPGKATFLPGHPMAGKESGGAALAEATLFNGCTWLFTPVTTTTPEPALAAEWRTWVTRFGAHVRDLEPAQHDELCAWVSHLPQMLSTALAALLQETFAADPAGLAAVQAIGGRALRETTRLGSSPYSMWRDVALTNTEPIAATLLALEQRLQHIRENLRTPELRNEFAIANNFRRRPAP